MTLSRWSFLAAAGAPSYVQNDVLKSVESLEDDRRRILRQARLFQAVATSPFKWRRRLEQSLDRVQRLRRRLVLAIGGMGPTIDGPEDPTRTITLRGGVLGIRHAKPHIFCEQFKPLVLKSEQINHAVLELELVRELGASLLAPRFAQLTFWCSRAELDVNGQSCGAVFGNR